LRKTQSMAGAWLFIVIVLLGVVGAICQWLVDHPAFAGGIGVAFLITVAKGISNRRQRALAVVTYNQAMLTLTETIIAGHAAELEIRRKQLTSTLNYGLIDNSKWLNEIEFFIDQVITPKGCDVRSAPERVLAVREMIDAATANYINSRVCFSADMDPIAYEHMVADALTDFGWQTRRTKGSGDQGIDVIAEMRDKCVVIQCKRYASAIGNAAVQEAYAGKSFENADYAAVVSNASFTRSARQLAKSTQVILLHHDELAQLQTHIFGTETWEHKEPAVLPALLSGLAKSSVI
jgi:HJR/Mrr/RecB family endonuclease